MPFKFVCNSIDRLGLETALERHLGWLQQGCHCFSGDRGEGGGGFNPAKGGCLNQVRGCFCILSEQDGRGCTRDSKPVVASLLLSSPHLAFCRLSTLSRSCCRRSGCLELDRMASTVLPSARTLRPRQLACGQTQPGTLLKMMINSDDL